MLLGGAKQCNFFPPWFSKFFHFGLKNTKRSVAELLLDSKTKPLMISCGVMIDTKEHYVNVNKNRAQEQKWTENGLKMDRKWEEKVRECNLCFTVYKAVFMSSLQTAPCSEWFSCRLILYAVSAALQMSREWNGPDNAP